MVIETWLIWLIIAGILAVGEILTEGFFLAWFAIGAALASIAAFIGLSSALQWGIFIVTSAVLLLFSRPFAERFTGRQPSGVGADRYTGKVGVVLEDIDNLKNVGRVRIDKEEWRADSGTGNIIPEGSRVKVTGLDGTHLVVVPLDEVTT
jgi:membrane protein implicated in regulation of membrane protease activity